MGWYQLTSDKSFAIDIFSREAPWSSRERHGLTIQALVLGGGFESRFHLKARWKDGPLDGRKITKDKKDSQASHTKKIYFLDIFSFQLTRYHQFYDVKI